MCPFLWNRLYLWIFYISPKCSSHLTLKIIGNLKSTKFWGTWMVKTTDYGHTKAKSLILCGLRFFCKNNGWRMVNIDKGLTVPKWVLIVRPKIPQMPQNLSAQFVSSCPKVLDFNEKRLHWAFVLRGQNRWKLEWKHREFLKIEESYNFSVNVSAKSFSFYSWSIIHTITSSISELSAQMYVHNELWKRYVASLCFPCPCGYVKTLHISSSFTHGQGRESMPS